MKKVGIVTFYRAYNYGAVLQAYALAERIKSLGYECEIIDYSMAGFLELRKRNRVRSLYEKIKRILTNPSYYVNVHIMEYKKQKKIKSLGDTIDIRNRKFMEFNKAYFKTNGAYYETYSQLADAELDYDAYVCGSDQIWNPYICELDPNYFLTFAPADKRVAYAPSIGISRIPEKMHQTYRDLLADMRFLSVREKQGAKELEKILRRKVETVVDPTLLLTRSDWEKLIPEHPVEEPYVLNYFLGDDKYVYQYIDAVEKKYAGRFKIVNLLFDLSSCGPVDMLSLIKGASLVFTNSFHGMLMSINFNVPFVVGKTLKDMQKRDGRSRVDEIMDTFQLKNRIWNFGEAMQEAWEELDYSAANVILETKRAESLQYLSDAIHSVVGEEEK